MGSWGGGDDGGGDDDDRDRRRPWQHAHEVSLFLFPPSFLESFNSSLQWKLLCVEYGNGIPSPIVLCLCCSITTVEKGKEYTQDKGRKEALSNKDNEWKLYGLAFFLFKEKELLCCYSWGFAFLILFK